MKKVALVLIAAMSMALFACQTSGSAGKTDTDAVASNGTTPAPTTPPATPAAPKKPDYLAKAEGMSQTTVEWTSDTYDYGTVASGEKVTHQFRFKNTGEAPLILTRVKPSCGCTTPTYTKEEIGPGEEGFIDVAFNSAGKSGVQNKTVTVTGNFAGTNKILRINGEVTAAPAN
ncbi:MAG: DUF1573 domain-containing protein [Bacteroidota bacterium]